MTDAPYEELPYADFPHPATHPDGLAGLAVLAGLSPAPLPAIRVLELGCGRGGNLIPLACLMPEGRFVGQDASPSAIEDAKATAAALGLGNICFEQARVEDDGPELGEFDYIIAHGLFSWVPPAVGRAVLSRIKAALAPQGVAQVSFNVLPGWHFKGAIRSLLLTHVPEGPNRAARARAFLEFIKRHHFGSETGWLIQEVDRALAMPDDYLLHEHLAPDNHPLYLTDFARLAFEAGLAYVGDPDGTALSPLHLPPETAAAVGYGASNQLELETRLDVLTRRPFRHAVLCHWERAPRFADLPARLATLRLTAELKPVLSPTIHFLTPTGRTVEPSSRAMTDALLKLAGVGPRGVPAASLLVPDEPEVADGLLSLWGLGVLKLGTWRLPLASTPSKTPRAFSLARHQAAQGADRVTTLTHESVPVDLLTRALLPYLDGTRDLGGLTAALGAQLARGDLKILADGVPLTAPELLAPLVEQKLRELRTQALLLSPEAV